MFTFTAASVIPAALSLQPAPFATSPPAAAHRAQPPRSHYSLRRHISFSHPAGVGAVAYSLVQPFPSQSESVNKKEERTLASSTPALLPLLTPQLKKASPRTRTANGGFDGDDEGKEASADNQEEATSSAAPIKPRTGVFVRGHDKEPQGGGGRGTLKTPAPREISPASSSTEPVLRARGVTFPRARGQYYIFERQFSSSQRHHVCRAASGLRHRRRHRVIK